MRKSEIGGTVVGLALERVGACLAVGRSDLMLAMENHT